MRCLRMKYLHQGLQRYKNVSNCRIVPGFNNAKEIRSIRMTHSTNQANFFSNTDEHNAMMALWPELVTDLTESELYPDIPIATKQMAEVLHYNVPRGRKHRGLTTIHCYCILAHPQQLTDENLKLVRVLGWCQEITQAFLQMQDDLMDSSKIRRDQPCWYLRDNIGITAVNDSLIVEHAVYPLLKRYFNKHKCYVNLLETFTEMTLHVAMGQCLDNASCNYNSKGNMNLFTMDRWITTSKYKGGYFCVVLPIKLAMYCAGITAPEIHKQMEPILIDMGHWYTARNDYYDIYSDPNANGHVGTDIQGGKCSWLVVTALQHATPTQRKILQECYGYEDPEKVARVKQVYDELNLATIHANYEEKAYNSIKTRIEQMTWNFPKELFDVLLAMIYPRIT